MEIGFDIVSLGLIYNVEVDENNNVHILMTMTTPVSVGGLIVEMRRKVKEIENGNDVDIELTFDPPWNPEMASDEVRMLLGL